MLQNGLQLIETLCHPSLGRRGSLVLVPEIFDFTLTISGEWGDQRQQIGSLLPGFREPRLLEWSWDITAERFPEVVDQAHFEEAGQIDRRIATIEHHRHKAEAP